jgi:hypothetical protein
MLHRTEAREATRRPEKNVAIAPHITQTKAIMRNDAKR